LKNNLAQSDASVDSGGGSGDELKMIIHKLVVEEDKARVRIAALGDTQQTISLPKLQLADVGKKSGGATAAEVAQVLSSKLLGNVQSSVASLDAESHTKDRLSSGHKLFWFMAGRFRASLFILL
jgi:hypothetical protein